MSAPTVTINEVQLQQVFDAFTKYLDTTDDFVRTENLAERVKGGVGIDIVEVTRGFVKVNSIAEDSDTRAAFAIIQFKDQLYISPGHVHFRSGATGNVYDSVEPTIEMDIEGTPTQVSVYDKDSRPFFQLPLDDAATDHTLYLIVNSNAAPHPDGVQAEFVIKKDTDTIETLFPESTDIFKLHSFPTDDDGNPRSKDDDGVQIPQLLKVEPVISGGGGINASFGFTQSGTTREIFLIKSGWIVYDGLGNFLVPETEIILTGGPLSWIYVEAATSAYGTNSIKQASGLAFANAPKSDGGKFRRVLYEIEFDLELGIYKAPLFRRVGDIEIATPIFTGGTVPP